MSNTVEKRSSQYERFIACLALFMEPEWFAKVWPEENYNPEVASKLYGKYLQDLNIDGKTIEALQAHLTPLFGERDQYFALCHLLTKAFSGDYADPPCTKFSEFAEMLNAVRDSQELTARPNREIGIRPEN